MKTEYIIMDTSVKYLNARNPLEEGLLYVGEKDWSRKLENAHKFTDSASAVDAAKKLHAELPVKVLVIQTEGNQIGVGEVKF